MSLDCESGLGTANRAINQNGPRKPRLLLIGLRKGAIVWSKWDLLYKN